MLLALNFNGLWVSQAMGSGSGDMYISNNTADTNGDEIASNAPYSEPLVTSDDTNYYYRLFTGDAPPEGDYFTLANETFYYTIYGE